MELLWKKNRIITYYYSTNKICALNPPLTSIRNVLVPRIGICTHECRANCLNANNVQIYYRQTHLEELLDDGFQTREIENMPLGGRLLPFPLSHSRRPFVRSHERRRQRPMSRLSTVYNTTSSS